MLGTTDGGQKWQELAAPRAPLGTPGSEVASGVSQVVFANPTDGWAYGPALWATSDGARSWHREGLGGPVLALTASGSFAFAVVGSCSLSSAKCTKPKVRLERSPVTTTGWAKVPGLTGSDNGVGAFFATHGRHIWLALWPKSPGRATIWRSSDGTKWQSSPDACYAPSEAIGLAGLATASQHGLFELCAGNPGAGQEQKTLRASANGGATTHEVGALPLGGLSSGIAAANDQDIAVTAASGASFIYYSRNGGRTWARRTFDDGGAGLSGIQFAGMSGAVIEGRPGAGSADRLLLSQDGGAKWAPASFR